MNAPVLPTVLWWSVAVAVGYLLTANLVVILRCAVAAGRRPPEAPPEERLALADSRFTIPVSLVVHVQDAGPGLVASITSLLELDYPQLEVIVLSDATRSGAIDSLRTAFALVPRHLFYRRNLPGPDVRAMYTGATEPRLLVIDQPGGGDETAAWRRCSRWGPRRA